MAAPYGASIFSPSDSFGHMFPLIPGNPTRQIRKLRHVSHSGFVKQQDVNNNNIKIIESNSVEDAKGNANFFK